MACPSCGRPIPDDARFCPSCGASLQAAAPEERRVVTVLFADVVGFTTLAEHRDPERVKRLVDAAFEQLVADVEAFGGRVDKILGDAIVALFGAPVAHEDDAERAVRTGLRMHETLRRVMAERNDVRSDPDADPDVDIRVGINTGEVLVGSVAGTDYTAMGDVVNTASRLQGLAPPGGVVVGDTTRRLCSDAIRFEPLEPVRLRGRDQLEQLWAAVGVDSPVRPRRRLAATPFVGRVDERSLLTSVVGLVLKGHGAIVSVTGEAGIGKSRLVDEVIDGFRTTRPDVMVLEGVCPPYGESNVWAPIANGIAAQIGLERGSGPDEVRAVVARRSLDLFGRPPESPAIRQELEAFLHLLGHPSELDRLDPAGARDILFGTVIAGVRRRAGIAPVVVWLDDLQWAHGLLVDLLQVLARSVADLSVLIVTASRPIDEAPWWGAVDRSLVLHFPLHPLDEEESATLVQYVTRGRAPSGLVERLYERSGGNPLFLTELALLAADPTHPVDELTGTSTDEELPGTLRALIASRLDQLGPAARAVVDNASILGSEGPVAGLQEFAAAMAQEWDDGHLDELVNCGLIELDGSWWRFRSDVVREVAYQTLTKQSRAQRHAGVATVMAGPVRGPLDELAHHAASAAELVMELGSVPGVRPEIGAWAVDLLGEAARRAYDMGGLRHGLSLSERALRLAADDPERRPAMLLLHAEGLVELRRHQEARGELEVVLDHAHARGDRIAEGEAHRLLGSVEQLAGDLVASRAQLGTAVDIFRELDDEPRLAQALRVRGYAEVFGGSLQDAEWYLGEADALHERLGDERGRAWVAQHRAWISFLGGAHLEAEERLLGAIATFREIGDHSGTTWTRGLLAFVYYFQRRVNDAEQLAADVLVEARRWGDDWGASMMSTLLANLRLWTGRFGEAVQEAERALVGFRRIGDQFGILQAMAPLNRARVALGRTNDAERGLEEILAVADSFGGLAFPSLAASGVAMHLGDGERTVDLALETVERMAATGASLSEARIQLALGHLQCGRPDEAMAALLDVDVPSSPFALAVRALVHAVLGDLDAALEDAGATVATPGASYFDLACATVAGAASASRLGTADRSVWLARLRERAAGTGDVVLGAVVREVLARVTVGEGGDAVEPPPGAVLAAGWTRLVGDVVGDAVGGAVGPAEVPG